MRAYKDVPAGGHEEIPPSIPSGLLYRVKMIEGVSKQTFRMIPNNGFTQVNNSQKIIVTLPPNALIDLSTFEMNFQGDTYHNGNGNAAANTSFYVQPRLFPRNSASLIENLEVKINGQSRQNIPFYNVLWNMIFDYSCGYDCTNKNRIGCNADPSNKHWLTVPAPVLCAGSGNAQLANYGGGVRRKAGFPMASCSDPASYRDETLMTIREWLGFLSGSGSTHIIDTNLYGQIDIEITLAPAGILMLGGLATPGAAQAVIQFNNAANEIGISTLGGGATAAIPAEASNGYYLSNIYFQVSRIDIPKSYYDAVNSVLQSGAVFKNYFPNYNAFQGQPTDKAGTTRFTITTESLDLVLGTFLVPARDTQSYPLLGKFGTVAGGNLTRNPPLNQGVALGTVGEWGSYTNTLQYHLMNGSLETFNNSKYLLRNGSGITQATWIVGNIRMNPETPQIDQFNSILRAFGQQNDTSAGVYPGIQSAAHYVSSFYGHALSLQIVGDDDELYVVSGLNTLGTPISIAWEVQGGIGTTNTFVNPDVVDNVSNAANALCTPLIFAAYSSHLDVSSGRNVIMYP